MRLVTRPTSPARVIPHVIFHAIAAEVRGGGRRPVADILDDDRGGRSSGTARPQVLLLLLLLLQLRLLPLPLPILSCEQFVDSLVGAWLRSGRRAGRLAVRCGCIRVGATPQRIVWDPRVHSQLLVERAEPLLRQLLVDGLQASLA